VLLEAMASGLPVVAADVPQTREVLGGAGHLFPPGDPSALADLIVRLAADPAERARSAEAGLAAARARAWGAIWDGLFRDYGAVVQEAREPGQLAVAARALAPEPAIR
jgi:glycosyltransferase involved in cell wall biosynthesis